LTTATTDLSTKLAKHREQIDEQGYTIIQNAIDQDFVAEILAVLDKLEEEIGHAKGVDRFRGFKTVKVLNLIGRHEVFRRLALNEYSRHIVEHVLGPGFLLAETVSMDLAPGEQMQPIHCDDMYLGGKLGRPHPSVACNTVWSITDFTAENGATVLVPGSHKRVDAPGSNMAQVIARADEAPPEGLISAEMPAGSLLIFEGALWHAGGANRSSERRVGVSINHGAGWVRPSQNNVLSMPFDLVRTFDPALQDMLGFGVYDGVIGRVGTLPPLEALAQQGR
jgi:ectoine hydroxylase-related dioxygenase (phytanoyl-CoA dioxygenase family)